jgi:hypothetical protein
MQSRIDFGFVVQASSRQRLAALSALARSFDFTLCSGALRSKALPIEWSLQLSRLKRIHALHIVSGEGDSAPVSATVPTLEDAYTDADSFETFLSDS